jgi:hypothetical protein
MYPVTLVYGQCWRERALQVRVDFTAFVLLQEIVHLHMILLCATLRHKAVEADLVRCCTMQHGVSTSVLYVAPVDRPDE